MRPTYSREFIMAHDLVNPATGKTWRQENLEKHHAIPLGTLVEVEPWDEQSEHEYGGARLFVASHDRDCDGTPLYSLAMKRGETRRGRLEHGFSEKSLHQRHTPTDSPNSESPAVPEQMEEE